MDFQENLRTFEHVARDEILAEELVLERSSKVFGIIISREPRDDSSEYNIQFYSSFLNEIGTAISRSDEGEAFGVVRSDDEDVEAADDDDAADDEDVADDDDAADERRSPALRAEDGFRVQPVDDEAGGPGTRRNDFAAHNDI